jgi:hypothetical protein
MERNFMNLYGSPVLQALVGLRTDEQRVRQLGRDIARETVAASARAKLVEQAGVGGTPEAIVRALLYVFRAPELRAADERAYNTLRELRAHSDGGKVMTLAHFKEVVQQQAQILSWDEEAGFNALPHLLPESQTEREVQPVCWKARRCVAWSAWPTCFAQPCPSWATRSRHECCGAGARAAPAPALRPPDHRSAECASARGGGGAPLRP